MNHLNRLIESYRAAALINESDFNDHEKKVVIGAIINDIPPPQFFASKMDAYTVITNKLKSLISEEVKAAKSSSEGGITSENSRVKGVRNGKRGRGSS